MESELRDERWAEIGDGVPFLLGLLISLSISIGLWSAVLWVGSQIPR